jgi:hypothetical protein
MKCYTKILITLIWGIILPSLLFGQINKEPLAKRSIYGVVQDSTSESVIGAAVTLFSTKDTLKTRTDNEGIFSFTNVKSSVFTIKVEALGFVPKIFNAKYSDTQAEITLKPIVLSTSFQILETVIVNGTPTIIYKPDTIEYRAKDYVLRAGDKIDELLKKLEGVDVDKDGSVYINGKKVEKSKLNGRELNGGDVNTTVQNLPAEIVDKIQFIDDYGVLASRTGNKDGAAQKTLNITTKTEKSVGNILGFNLAAGTQEQAELGINFTRINKNETLTANLKGYNSIAGIVGANYKNGQLGSAKFELPNELLNGGSNLNVLPRVSLNSKLSAKINLNLSYSLNATARENFLDTNGQEISNLGIINNISNRNNDLRQTEHIGYFTIEYNIDSLNFLTVNPQINISQNNTNSLNNKQLRGLINQNQDFNNKINNNVLNFKSTVVYQHLWRKNKRKNLAAELFINLNSLGNDLNQNLAIAYLNNNTAIGDSINRLRLTDDYRLENYRGKLSYTQPISKFSKLVISQSANFKNFSNTKNTFNSVNNNNFIRIDTLSNSLDYLFKQAISTASYSYKNYNKKLSGILGANVFYTSLSNNSTLQINFTKPAINFFPYLNLNLSLSNTQQASLYFSGSITEPSLQQLQPVADIAIPQNKTLGNPNLSFVKTYLSSFSYSNYFMYSKINLSFNLNSAVNRNAIGTNIIQVQDNFGSLSNQIIYTNVRSNSNLGLNYNISKQLNNRKYSIELKGKINQSNFIQLSNGLENKSNNWNFNENLNIRISVNDRLEINPNISLENSTTTFSLLNTNKVKQQILSLNINSAYYFKTKQSIATSISQAFINGIANNSNNTPLIVNTMFRQKFKNDNGEFSFSVYDAFKQNNFIVRSISPEGFNEVLTNTNSRYFMLGFTFNLQKWTSAKTKNGDQVKRKGDGSFIN